MFGKNSDSTSRDRGRKRERRLLIGALGLVAAVWFCPVRVGVVSGHSMDPTLRTGQILAVDHSYYRHSSPSVGDVVLFHGEHGVYVKRVYAVAGQTVSMVEQDNDGEVERIPVARGAERRVARAAANGDVTLRRVTIPAGSFFALGDAIHNSEDSRDFGPVPVNRIIGRVLPIGASLNAPDVECHDVVPVRVAGRLIGTAIL